MQISLSLPNDPDGIGLSGKQDIKVTANPAGVISIWVDGKSLAKSLSTTSFTTSWDTTKFPDGTHVIKAEAQYKTRKSSTQIAVTTKNSVPVPTSSGYGAGEYGSGEYGGS